MHDPNILTREEVAILLGVSTRTVQRLQADGRIGYSRVGRLIQFSRGDVQEYLDTAHRQPARGQRLDLAGLSEIALRSGVRNTAVVNWMDRYVDFPATVADLKCGPIFWWPHVEEWLLDTDRL